MPDEFDRASETEELMRVSAIYEQTKLNVPEAEATGQCLYCGETLKQELRWCDADCRDDWEWERKRK